VFLSSDDSKCGKCNGLIVLSFSNLTYIVPNVWKTTLTLGRSRFFIPSWLQQVGVCNDRSKRSFQNLNDETTKRICARHQPKSLLGVCCFYRGMWIVDLLMWHCPLQEKKLDPILSVFFTFLSFILEFSSSMASRVPLREPPWWCHPSSLIAMYISV
jgi:hypothetical protein